MKSEFPHINEKKVSKLGLSECQALQTKYEKYYEELRLKRHSLYGKERDQNMKEMARIQKQIIKIASANLKYREKHNIY